MKKVLLLTLVLLILFSASSCAMMIQSEAPPEMTSATLKSKEELQGYLTTEALEGQDSLTRVIYSDSYKATEVREFTLDAIFGRNRSGYAIKWNETVFYYLDGIFNDSDVDMIKHIAMALDDIDGLPGMQRVENKSAANLTITYERYKADEIQQPDDDDDDETSVQRENIYGTSVVRCTDNANTISIGEITIMVGDVSKAARTREISKQLFCVLGLPNTSEVYADSIFATENGYTVPEPTDIDYIALSLLYDERLVSGSNYSDAFITFDQILSQ